jgi:hypothetical protein
VFKKKLEKKKKCHKPLQKKGTGTAFCAGPLTPIKKVGVEQEKVAQVVFGSADFAPPNRLPKKNITRFKEVDWEGGRGSLGGSPAHSLSPRAFLLGLFLTQVSKVWMWVPIN